MQEEKDAKRMKRKKTLHRIEVCLAIVLTIALVVSVPVFAWFNSQRRMAKLAKIKAPDDLYINAAHKEDKIHLDMRDVNVSKKYKDGQVDKPITSQNFVFSVSGNYVSRYTLQLVHTTNNPYTYTIYEGEVYKATKDAQGNIVSAANVVSGSSLDTDHPNWRNRKSDGSFNYVEYVATNDWDDAELERVTFPAENPNVTVNAGDTLIIYMTTEVTNMSGNTGDYLNLSNDGRTADSTLTSKSYGSYSNFNKYADPLVWQLKNIPSFATKGSAFYNTYVINVSWTGVDDIANYDKETDMVYICAFVE